MKELLVVDDSFFARRILGDLIEEIPNVRVSETAGDGKEALRILRSEGGFDLITLDLGVPTMGGLETLKEIRGFTLDVPVLVVSSLSTDGADKTARALELGADDYLPKPGKDAHNLSEVGDELAEKIKALTNSGPTFGLASRLA